jgi:hypothetical protein
MRLGLAIAGAAAALVLGVATAAADAPAFACVDAKGGTLFAMVGPAEKGWMDQVAQCLEAGGLPQPVLKK